MKMGNDRLYSAVQSILFGEGDARSRVVTACQILRPMGRNEVDMSLRIRIDEVLQKASPKPALRDSNGDVLAGRDKYQVSAMNRRNFTYVKLAKEIYSIYEDDLAIRGLIE